MRHGAREDRTPDRPGLQCSAVQWSPGGRERAAVQPQGNVQFSSLLNAQDVYLAGEERNTQVQGELKMPRQASVNSAQVMSVTIPDPIIRRRGSGN